MQRTWYFQVQSSRVAKYFYLHLPPNANKCYRKGYNAPIHVECSTLKNVVSSAAEAECGGIFQNCENQFHIKWDKGIHNIADYFTKHHPPSHHRTKRYDYI